MRKFVNKEGAVEREREGEREREKGQEEQKDRDVKTFHSLLVTSTHKRTAATLERGYLPLQMRPLNCYFQQREALKAEQHPMNTSDRFPIINGSTAG